jgi:hypothetical protein
LAEGNLKTPFRGISWLSFSKATSTSEFSVGDLIDAFGLVVPFIVDISAAKPANFCHGGTWLVETYLMVVHG